MPSRQAKLFPIFFIFTIALTTLLGGCSPQKTVSTPTPNPILPTAKPTPSEKKTIGYPGAFSSLASRSRFVHLTQEHGLSQSGVYSIFQDNQGYMWISTQDGLNRYDGYDFRIFRPENGNINSLADKSINETIQDSNGNIWIGTQMGGLHKYDPATEIFTRYQKLPENSGPCLSTNSVTSVIEDQNQTLWVGTTKGIDLLDLSTGEIKPFRYKIVDAAVPFEKYVSTLFLDSKGNIWVGTRKDGLINIDPGSQELIHYYQNINDLDSISSNNILSITEGPRGNIWVGTDTGINIVTPGEREVAHIQPHDSSAISLSNEVVNTLVFDQNDILWIGTNNGLYAYNEVENNFEHYYHQPFDPESLNNNTILSLYIDQNDTLWIGTMGGGINLLEKTQKQFVHLGQNPDSTLSLSNPMVFPIHADKSGTIWIGTLGGGLNRYEPKTGLVEHIVHNPYYENSLRCDRINSLLVDNNGIVWVGTTEGLDWYYPDTKDFRHFDPIKNGGVCDTYPNIYDIFQDSNDQVWVGYCAGVKRYDPKNDSFILYSSNSKNPNTFSLSVIVEIFEDNEKNLWFGSLYYGLTRYNPKTDTYKRFMNNPNEAGSISNDSILSVFQDSKGVIWVGTSGGGLNRFDPQTETFTNFQEIDGLPNNVVYGILEDPYGYLWLSTNNGLSRFDPGSSTFQNFNVNDGLQGNEFNMNAYAKGRWGELYFGGINGVTIIPPMLIETNTNPPPVVLNSITNNGEPIHPEISANFLDSVILNWPQDSFEFEFSALNFVNPEDNRYAYRLDPFDEGWIHTGNQRTGRYTNLPAGEYTLQMIASNQDQVWNMDGKTISVKIIPPIWQTWGFRIGNIIFFGGLIAVLSLTRSSRNQKRRRELEFLVKERTSELEVQKSAIEALYSADEQILRTQNSHQILKLLVEIACENLQADCSVIFTWDKIRELYEPKFSQNVLPQSLKKMQFTAEEQLFSRILFQKKIIRINHILHNGDEKSDSIGILDIAQQSGILSIVLIPMTLDEERPDIFCAGFKTTDAITDEKERLLTALVQRVELSKENRELLEQTRDLAVLEERNRLARDLHDSAKQKAFAALAQLGAANRLAESSPTVKKPLKKAEDLVFEVIEELTFLIQEMYPKELIDKGLKSALRDYVFAWEERNDIHINLEISGGDTLPLAQEQALYRIAQEALANVSRHSKANQVKIELVFEPNTTIIIITDNGIGFSPDTYGCGIGLRSMQERVEPFDGRLTITSQPGNGTCLEVQIPKNSIQETGE